MRLIIEPNYEKLSMLRIKTSLLYSVCQLVLHQRACMLSW